MDPEIRALIITAASIGFFHTLLGPDHYLPFVMMSWARKWNTLKTGIITFICGLGHIASSIVLGFVGIAVGLGVQKLELVESVRGNLAAWLLIGFGLAYLVWGIRKAYRDIPHRHAHGHESDGGHAHEHTHHFKHAHVHDRQAATSVAPWTLFVIFVFGPCEPLIPMLMYPAAKNNISGLIIVTCVFGMTTISTMLAMVLLARGGVNFLPVEKIQKYSHVIAGATILICGLAIQFLGL